VRARLAILDNSRLERKYRKSAQRGEVCTLLQVEVVRDGVHMRVPPSILVPGDVVHMHAGSRAWCDMRVVSASADARRDMSALTGESEPLRVCVEATNANVMDTHNHMLDTCFLVQGECVCVVLAVGSRTVMGRIASLLKSTSSASSFSSSFVPSGASSSSFPFSSGGGIGKEVQEVFSSAGLMCKSALSAGTLLSADVVVCELDALYSAPRLTHVWCEGSFVAVLREQHLAQPPATGSLLVHMLLGLCVLGRQDMLCGTSVRQSAALVEKLLVRSLPGDRASAQRTQLDEVAR
jgi:E1-E2 ATPase